MRGVAIHDRDRKGGLNAAPEPVAQHGQTYRFRFEAGHAHDRRGILRAGPALILMRAAVLEALKRKTGAQVKKTGADRAVKLVRRERKGIEILCHKRLLPEGLDGVGVKEHAPLPAER